MMKPVSLHICVLVSAAAIISLMPDRAIAAIVSFDNSAGEFYWQARESYWNSGGWEVPTYLDITQPPSQNASPAYALGEEHRHPTPNLRPGWVSVFGLGKAAVACDDPIATQASYGPASIDPVRPLSFGEAVGPNLNWKSEGFTAWYQDPSFMSIPDATYFTPGAYIGVRITLDDGVHYGWIGGTGWGYEASPGVTIPAGVPEPAGIALFALGAVPLLARRRGRHAIALPS